MRIAPVAWNMPLVLGIATVLGIGGVFASFGLFYLGERVLHLNREVIQSYVSQVVCRRSSHDLRHAHPAGFLVNSSYADPPTAGIGTQLVATVIAVYGIFMAPIGWGWALFIRGYALAWFFVNDRIKLAAYDGFDPQEKRLFRRIGMLAKHAASSET